MSKGTCQQAGCTIAETGICLLSNAPPSTCPNFRAAVVRGVDAAAEQVPAQGAPHESVATSSIPARTAGGRRFHTGLELGSEDALEVSRGSYCHLIGILGAWDAGKTCFLLSFYLMACRAELPKDYAFAGSLTLKGFEDRARHLRRWTGGSLPVKLADHTRLTETREAGMLHLALQKHGADARRIDLLLTDLPGEWSKTLIDNKHGAERFKFLTRADGIIIVVDGPALGSSARHVELMRAKHLLERLKTDVGVEASVPMTLLISKGDKIAMKAPDATDELSRHARTLGFAPNVVVAAAFSYDTTYKSGDGVFEAIEPLIAVAPAPRPDPSGTSGEMTRRFAAFGRVS